MGCVNFCGFETGDASEMSSNQFFGEVGGVSVQSAIAHSDGYAFRSNPSAFGQGYCFFQGLAADGTQVDASVVTSYARFYFRWETLPSGFASIFGVSGGGSDKFHLRINSSGQLSAYNFITNTVIVTSISALSASTWYLIEVKVGTGASAAWEVKVNGVSWISGTGENFSTNNTGSVFLGVVQLAAEVYTVDFYFDDLYWADDAYPGPGHCAILVPNAAGNYQTWTRGGTDSGANFSQVNTIPVSSSKYLTSPLVSTDTETESLSNAGTAGITGSTINCAKSIAVIGKNSILGGSVKIRLRSTSTNSDAASAYTTTDQYVPICKLFPTDPATASAWGIDGLNGVETGLINLSITDGSRMDFTGLLVDFVPSFETNVNTVGRFRSAAFSKAAFLSIRQGLAEDFNAPPPEEVISVGFVAPFRKSTFSKAAFLSIRQGIAEDLSAPLPEAETNVNTVGKFQRSVFNKTAFLFQQEEPPQDFNAPPPAAETNVNTVGRFRSAAFSKAAFLSIRQGITEDLSAPLSQSEIDISTHNKFKPTEFNKAAFYNARQGINCDFPIEFQSTQLGQYRIQNLSAEGYLVYVGPNGPPDFTKDAAVFSSSLPVSLAWPLPGSGIQTLYVVPRFRDSYGCISQNSNPTIIRLSPTGEIFGPVPPLQSVFAYPRPSTKLGIAAQYPTLLLDKHPADQLRVWVGATPPDVTGGTSYQGLITTVQFSVEFGTFTPGTYYVAVALYRSSDGAMSIPVLLTVVFPEIPAAPQAVFTENVTAP